MMVAVGLPPSIQRVGGAAGALARAGAEGGGEVEGLDFDLMFKHHPDREGRVEPPERRASAFLFMGCLLGTHDGPMCGASHETGAVWGGAG